MDFSKTPTTRVRQKGRLQIRCSSPVSLAVGLSAFLLVFYNARFWRETVDVLWAGTVGDTLFLVSLFVFLLFLHAAFLLLIAGRRIFNTCVALLFVVAALASYSADTYGVAIDKEMIRNLFETDRREVAALLNLRFWLYVLFLGVVPALLVWRVKRPDIGVKKQVRQRGMFLAAGLVLNALLIFAFSAHYSAFVREHKALRYWLSPGSAVQATVQYVRKTLPEAAGDTFIDDSGTTMRVNTGSSRKPLLVFLVVGETARAANFGLGGYERATNPQLMKTDNVFYFNNVFSCGTATAVSLPCMFSSMGRENFNISTFSLRPNLLDALVRAGIGVEWRDNNSGSKGVSARVKTITFDTERNSALCNDESCYDEILLSGLDQTLRHASNDMLIAFHHIGSHGPSYAKRYPKHFELFQPVCGTNELNRCTDEELRNAYDNSIVYTDYNLARQIEMLTSLSDRFDTALLYVSDHGESLGENRLYLHGAPYLLAPETQKKVPLILWMSDGFLRRQATTSDCVRRQADKQFSHDNVYHTVLGMMEVRNARFQSDLDMLAACRRLDSAMSISAGARPGA